MIKKTLSRIRFAFKKDEPYSRLKRILGFSPTNMELYHLAMRHRSMNSHRAKDKLYNNERLEFLGDSILSSVVSDIVYHQFPEYREGDLTTLRSKVVQRATLDQLAVDIGLKPLIISYSKTDSDKDKHITGNAFEALIGAIYLDKGYAQCKKFILSLIRDKFIDIEQLSRCEINFKSKFIEWTQRRKVSYQFHHTIQDSAYGNYFLAELYVEGILVGSGNGHSKKEAEQRACKIALGTIKKKTFKQELNQIKPDVSLQIATDVAEEDNDTP